MLVEVRVSSFFWVWLACASGEEAWKRASTFQHALEREERAMGTDPQWVDVSRECSQVPPWSPHFQEARALKEAIERARLRTYQEQQPTLKPAWASQSSP